MFLAFFFVLIFAQDEILPHGTMMELLRQGFSAAYDKVMYDRRGDETEDERGEIVEPVGFRKGWMWDS